MDKMLENQAKIITSVALLEQRSAQKEKTIDKLEGKVESLNKFRWGVVGTAGFSIITFIKSLYS